MSADVRKQRGSTLLLIMTVVVPLILLSLTISFDVAKYYAEQQETQKALDEALLHAARQMPYRDEARSVLAQYLSTHYRSRFGEDGLSGVTLRFHDDVIEARYEGTATLVFGPLLERLTSGSETPIVVSVLSYARSTPFDAYIAMDSSAQYLSPQETDTPWGSDMEWPAAQFFHNEYTFVGRNGPIPPRISTQQCFNPVFSTLKEATLSAYTYLSNFATDQIGVGVYPGRGRPLDTLRAVVTRADNTAAQNGTHAEAALVNYYGSNRGDSFCAAASERESYTQRYKFPQIPYYLSEWEPDGTPPVNITLPPHFSYNPDFIGYASVKQSLWATSTRDGTPADFRSTLDDISTQLLSAQVLAARGNLNRSPLKLMFMFSADVPWAQGTRWTPTNTAASERVSQAISLLRERVLTELSDFDFKVKLFYVVFDHEGLSSPIAPMVPQLQQLFTEASKQNGVANERFSAQVLYLADANAMKSSLVPNLLVGQRSVVLSR